MSPGQRRRVQARELWRVVFDGVRDCWLTISLQHLVEHIETHIGRLFDRHLMVFGKLGGQDDSSEPATAYSVEDYGRTSLSGSRLPRGQRSHVGHLLLERLPQRCDSGDCEQGLEREFGANRHFAQAVRTMAGIRATASEKNRHR